MTTDLEKAAQDLVAATEQLIEDYLDKADPTSIGGFMRNLEEDVGVSEAQAAVEAINKLLPPRAPKKRGSK